MFFDQKRGLAAGFAANLFAAAIQQQLFADTAGFIAVTKEHKTYGLFCPITARACNSGDSDTD